MVGLDFGIPKGLNSQGLKVVNGLRNSCATNSPFCDSWHRNHDSNSQHQREQRSHTAKETHRVRADVHQEFDEI